MIDLKGHCTCDREVLSLTRLRKGFKRGQCWKSCGRKAKVMVLSSGPRYGCELHYCEHHTDAAMKEKLLVGYTRTLLKELS